MLARTVAKRYNSVFIKKANNIGVDIVFLLFCRFAVRLISWEPSCNICLGLAAGVSGVDIGVVRRISSTGDHSR